MVKSENKKQKHIFIDTNILLDIYDLNQKGLDKMRKVVEGIINEELKFYISKQVHNEFKENRKNKFKNVFDKLEKLKGKDEFENIFNENAVLKNYPEYVKLSKTRSDLIQKAQDDIESNNLIADSVIRSIFNEAGIIESYIYLEKAMSRIQAGNPPGEIGKHGDAINWELLLDEVPEGEDLFLVTKSDNFLSEGSGMEIDSSLKSEWQKEKNSNVYLCNSLGWFFS